MDNSVAIGKIANAQLENSIAIGNETYAHKNALAIGLRAKAQSQGSFAFGTDAQIGLDAENAIAFGVNAKVAHADAIAFGTGASSQVIGGIALGVNALADRASGVEGYNRLNQNFGNPESHVWTATKGAVSVGRGGSGYTNEETRQIIHVAAGTNATDAVNVAQLKASQATVELKERESILTLDDSEISADGIKYKLGLDTSKLPQTKVEGGDGVTVTPINGINSTTYTVGLDKDQKFDTVIANTVTADTVNIGTNISLDKTNGLVFTGGPSVTTTGINAGGKIITQVADGTSNTDAVNYKQLMAVRTSVTVDKNEKNLTVQEKTADPNTLNRSFKVGLND